MEKNIKNPPKIAQSLLSVCANRDETSAIMGDLEEEYFFIAKSRGVWRARLWYCTLILISVPSFLTHFIYWRFIMFSNYMKIALRNIGRHPSYSVINIAGLAIGLT